MSHEPTVEFSGRMNQTCNCNSYGVWFLCVGRVGEAKDSTVSKLDPCHDSSRLGVRATTDDPEMPRQDLFWHSPITAEERHSARATFY